MRALILSDIHANLEALNAVLDAASGAFDTVWNLGDSVGYGASPNQVIERIRSVTQLNVRGNHDRACCGLTSALNFNPVARAAASWTREELLPANLEWLRSVPQGPLQPEPHATCIPAVPCIPSVACVHGSPLHEDQYILSMRDAWAPLQQMQTALTFFGHTHIQGGFSRNGHDWHEVRPRYQTANEAETWTMALPSGTRHLINPGSVGQPRDCDWRAAYAIYDDRASQVTYHRTPYDVTASQGRILMAGLPERLALRLREGR